MHTKYFDQNDQIDQDNDRIDHLNIYLFNWYLYLNKLIFDNSTTSITTKDKEYNLNAFYSGFFVVPNKMIWGTKTSIIKIGQNIC